MKVGDTGKYGMYTHITIEKIGSNEVTLKDRYGSTLKVYRELFDRHWVPQTYDPLEDEEQKP